MVLFYNFFHFIYTAASPSTPSAGILVFHCFSLGLYITIYKLVMTDSEFYHFNLNKIFVLHSYYNNT